MLSARLKHVLGAAFFGVVLALTPVSASATCYTKYDVEEIKANLVILIEGLEEKSANYPRHSHVGRILRHKLRYSYRLLARLDRYEARGKRRHHVHGRPCHPNVSRS